MKYFKLFCKKCKKNARPYHEYTDEIHQCIENCEHKCWDDWWILECERCKIKERV